VQYISYNFSIDFVAMEFLVLPVSWALRFDLCFSKLEKDIGVRNWWKKGARIDTVYT
jgi:hypothetical protein